ncbi:hypothetical protein [Allosalinactinospora lopnorensis]|uniref:hypothetical protein n=1 Tax=Allosalinactinospora lopnorensis TaxID=1352348 RepID=UPI000623D1DF|nr:hypothetical protein [Allosalinactinospora lopnorensis]
MSESNPGGSGHEPAENPAREAGMRCVSTLLTNLEQLIRTADEGTRATADEPETEQLHQVLEHAASELRKTREHLFQEGLFGESKEPKLFY